MEARDINLDNLPVGTLVKIVDKWRKENDVGRQNHDGGMDIHRGCIKSLAGNVGRRYYTCQDDFEFWGWYPEFFEAIKLPNSDTWYKVIEKDGKYVATDYANGEIISNSIAMEMTRPRETKVYISREDIKEMGKSYVPMNEKYYVFVSGKHNPKILHDTYEKAEQEAKRLSEKEVGYLVSICKVEKQFISKIIVEEV